jgi:two-component system, OmpR family, response regulator BaeR
MTSSLQVLIVEDDPKISQILVDYLECDGFKTLVASDGKYALEIFEKTSPNVIILDFMLPGLDGVSVCRHIRRVSQVPIMMLTARVDEIDKILGLDSGADDYVCKPFSPREVVARVRALMRRSEGTRGEPATPWQIDDVRLRITWRGSWLALTPVEFRLLRLLLSYPGRVFSRNQLLESAHDDTRNVIDRVIDSHMKNIRRKLDNVDPGSDVIGSVYGVGYRFDSPEA